MTAPTESAPSRATADDFIDVLCADDDLVDEEFAAIIAANWCRLPPPEHNGPPPARWPGRPRGARADTGLTAYRAAAPRLSELSPQRRPRSPP